MKNNEDEVAAITDANLEISEQLEDSEVQTNIQGDTEATNANLEIDKAFNHQEEEESAPTYLMYDTPAIRINPKR